MVLPQMVRLVVQMKIDVQKVLHVAPQLFLWCCSMGDADTDTVAFLLLWRGGRTEL